MNQHHEDKKLWEMLGDAEVIPAHNQASVWPEVRRRTLERTEAGSWFFGTGKILRTGLATSAVAAGLLLGIMVPGFSGTANALDNTETEWLDQSSWLDDAASDDLTDLWLDTSASLDESDGS